MGQGRFPHPSECYLFIDIEQVKYFKIDTIHHTLGSNIVLLSYSLKKADYIRETFIQKLELTLSVGSAYCQKALNMEFCLDRFSLSNILCFCIQQQPISINFQVTIDFPAF